MFLNFAQKLFGTRNDREIKHYKKRVELINALESRYEAMDDEALKGAFTTLREKVNTQQANLDEALNDVFAIVREVSKRTTGMRHFDVQMIGGLVLHEGRIAEMKTGEGKTL